jgi:hypothetical protein
MSDFNLLKEISEHQPILLEMIIANVSCFDSKRLLFVIKLFDKSLYKELKKKHDISDCCSINMHKFYECGHRKNIIYFKKLFKRIINFGHNNCLDYFLKQKHAATFKLHNKCFLLKENIKSYDDIRCYCNIDTIYPDYFIHNNAITNDIINIFINNGFYSNDILQKGTYFHNIKIIDIIIKKNKNVKYYFIDAATKYDDFSIIKIFNERYYQLNGISNYIDLIYATDFIKVRKTLYGLVSTKKFIGDMINYYNKTSQ